MARLSRLCMASVCTDACVGPVRRDLSFHLCCNVAMFDRAAPSLSLSGGTACSQLFVPCQEATLSDVGALILLGDICPLLLTKYHRFKSLAT
jgi:hypothetical protein